MNGILQMSLWRFIISHHKPGKLGILGDFSEHGKLREFCVT